MRKDEASEAMQFDRARRVTLDAQLARAASQYPDRVALKLDGRELTYGRLDARVTALSSALLERGVEKGQRLSVMMQNRLEVVEAYFAIIRCGGVCVPVNFRLAAQEVDYILAQSGSSFLFIDRPCTDVALGCARVASGRVKVISVSGGKAARIGEDYEAIVGRGDCAPLEAEVEDHEPAFIMYTSGTTGRPKGAVLTHLNLLVNSLNMIAALEISSSDRRWLAGLPLFHIGGLNGILPFLYLGGTSVILPSGNFDAGAVVDLMEKEQITSCFFVPTQWQEICEVPGIAGRGLLVERATWGASVCPPSVTEAIHRAFPGARTYNVFGQTEMSSVTCALRVDRYPDKRASIGTPVPGVEIRIVDEQMQDVPDGEAGEIVYRGPTVMQGYWEMPEATESAFKGGWFHSGDLVKKDADGFLSVVDRRTDMIISGGENIYCPEVEAAIDAHPSVREVAVVGAPHPKWVETPVAFIVLESDCRVSAEEIIEWCRKRLASYKKPTQVYFTPALPRNASGKILKTELRKRVTSF